MAQRRLELKLTHDDDGRPGASAHLSGLDEDMPEALARLLDAMNSPGAVAEVISVAGGLGVSVEVPDSVAGWVGAHQAREEAEAAARAFSPAALPEPLKALILALSPGDQARLIRLAHLPTSLLIAGRGDGAPALALGAARLAAQLSPLERVTIAAPPSLHRRWEALLAQLPAEERGPFRLVALDKVFGLRKELAAVSPHMILVDDAHRIRGGRILEGLKAVGASRILAISPVAPEEDPLLAWALVSLLAPELSGPRRAWWLGRFGGDDPDGRQELAQRFAPVRADGARAQASEALLIPLVGSQRSRYERTQASLAALLEAEHPTRQDEARAAELALTLLQLCDSTALPFGGRPTAAKQSELETLIAAEVISRGRKAVIFTRYEAMGKAIGERLTELGVGHARFYRKLPRDRRAGLIERFNDDAQCRVLVASDVDRVEGTLSTDLLIHYDVPWDPARLLLRRERVAEGAEEITLVAQGTVEEALFSEDGPVDGGTSADPATLGPGGADRARLRRLLGLEEAEAGAPAAGAGPAIPAEAEAGAPPQGGGLATSAPSPAEADAPGALDRDPPQAPTPEQLDSALAHEGHPMAEEAPPRPPPAEPPRPSQEEPEPAPEEPVRRWERVLAALDAIEVPLKAVNRLAAGLPWVGRPLTEAARVVWEQINAAAGRR